MRVVFLYVQMQTLESTLKYCGKRDRLVAHRENTLSLWFVWYLTILYQLQKLFNFMRNSMEMLKKDEMLEYCEIYISLLRIVTEKTMRSRSKCGFCLGTNFNRYPFGSCN